MTDLFTRLIDRARGEVPVIEPRKPSRFEATAAIGADPMAGEGELDVQDFEVSAPASMPEPEHERPRFVRSEPLTGEPPRGDPPQLEIQHSSRAQDITLPAEPARRDAHPRKAGEIRRVEPETPPAREDRVVPRPVPPPVQPAPPAEGTRLRESIESGVRGEDAVQQPERRRIETVQPVPRPAFEHRVAANTPSAERSERHIETRAEPSTEITISIGRVEVRAIRETERPRPQSRPFKPALTLEQYMEKRDGGRK